MCLSIHWKRSYSFAFLNLLLFFMFNVSRMIDFQIEMIDLMYCGIKNSFTSRKVGMEVKNEVETGSLWITPILVSMVEEQ